MGNGSIADWGAHHFDILQWALGTELSGPVAIENVKTDIRDPNVVNRYLDQAKTYQFDIVYADGFRAHVGDLETIGFNGLKFHGTKGDLFVTRGKIVLPEALKSWKESDLKGSDVRLYHNVHANGCHEMDFTDAVYEGRQPACPVPGAHLAQVESEGGARRRRRGGEREARREAPQRLVDLTSAREEAGPWDRLTR